MRFLIGSLWHALSALVIGPALLILNRLPNRGSGKRVKILSNLLFWLLLSAIINAVQKMGILGGIFQAKRIPNTPMESSPTHLAQAGIIGPQILIGDQKQSASQHLDDSKIIPRLSRFAHDQTVFYSAPKVGETPQESTTNMNQVDSSSISKFDFQHSTDLSTKMSIQNQSQEKISQNSAKSRSKFSIFKRTISSEPNLNPIQANKQNPSKFTPNGSLTSSDRNELKQSAIVVFICWPLELGKRIVSVASGAQLIW